VQVIIDRFSMANEKEIDAVIYLKSNLSQYYQEFQFAFIDSRCCDYLQIIDVVMSVVDEKNIMS
jgi:predicted O-methyltransferase YrrM